LAQARFSPYNRAAVHPAPGRVLFEHDLPAFSGMTELTAWDTLP
jgi:hypothetical protein